MMDIYLLANRANKKGLHQDPNVIRHVTNFLAADVIDMLVKETDAEYPPISERAIKEHYEKTKVLYRQEGYFTVDEIEVPSREEADKLRKQLLDGAAFDTLARDHSKAPSARNGGRMIRIQPGVVESPLYRFMEKLTIDAVSDVYERSASRFGIYKVSDRRPAAMQPLERVKDRIMRTLVERRNEKVLQKIEDAAVKSVKCEFHADRLSSEDPSAQLASVEGVIITRSSLLDALSKLPSRQKRRFSSETGKVQFLKSIFRRALFYRFSQKSDDFKKRHGIYLSYLQQEKIAQQLVQHEIAAGITASNEEVREAYDRQRERFKVPNSPYLKTRHILYTDKGYPDAKQAAQKAIDEITKGTPFVELVKRDSKDTTNRDKEGLCGWHTRGRMNAAYYDSAAKLDSNGITIEPVRVAGLGYYVIQLVEKSDYRPFELLAQHLRNQIKTDKSRKKLQEIINKERASTRTFTFPERLDVLDARAPLPNKTSSKNIPPIPTTPQTKGVPKERKLTFKAKKGPDGSLKLAPVTTNK